MIQKYILGLSLWGALVSAHSVERQSVMDYIEAPYVFNMNVNPLTSLKIKAYDNNQSCLAINAQQLGKIDNWLELVTLTHRASIHAYPRITFLADIRNPDVCNNQCPQLGCPNALRRKFDRVFLFDAQDEPIIFMTLDMDLKLDQYPALRGSMTYEIVDYDEQWWGDSCTREQLDLPMPHNDYNILAVADQASLLLLSIIAGKSVDDFKSSICNTLKTWLHGESDSFKENEVLWSNVEKFREQLNLIDITIDNALINLDS